jgi:3-oxoacyl-[acyl-carrier protein] reductase
MPEGAIVTGGTKGLGRAISLMLARAGFEVIALYSSDVLAADALCAELAAQGLRGGCVRHDISTGPPALQEPEAWDAITIVNNAWPQFEPRPFHLVPWAEVERAFQVGVGGAYHLTRALLPKMVRTGRGTIVNVLSVAVHAPIPRGFGGYALAKQALRGLTLSVAAEYGHRGVRAFSVSPPYMHTPLTAQWNETLRRALAATQADVDGVARAIVARVRDPESGKHGEDYRVP